MARSYKGRITGVERLTHDIRGLDIALDQPMKFWAGQYADITVTTKDGTTITRSFSMANTPEQTEKLAFIIKKYPQGRFSGELDSGGIEPGAEVTVTGPYGTCFRRSGRDGPLILVAAGSGMAPIWSILNDHVASGERRPVYFFYGARTRADLFHTDRIAALLSAHEGIAFIPVLSHADNDAEWQGERGFVHERVADHLKALGIDGAGDVYACGPPPMIDALQPVLFMAGFENERVFFDKFTTTTAGTPETASPQPVH